MGSFINVVAHRSLQGRRWWGNERSICESCGHVLTPIELIPVFSWIFQRGKCKNCGTKISFRYLLVEIIGALGAALLAYKFNFSAAFFLCLTGFFGAFLSALTDYESGDIFDLFALITGLAGLIIRFFFIGGFNALLDGLIGAVTGWGIFAAIIFLSRGGMGWGDACFMCGMGAVLGFKFTLIAFYLGIMLGGFAVIFLLITGRVKFGRGDTLPLVPYLAVGCFFTFLFGDEILNFFNIYFNFDLNNTSWRSVTPWPFF